MKIKTPFFDIKIDIIFIIIMFIFLFSNNIRSFLSSYLICYLFIVFHESSHMFVATLFGKEIEIFNKEFIEELRLMMKTGVEHEINWGNYVIGENIQGINKNLIDSYIKYLGNKRLKEIGLEPLFDGYDKNPAPWVDSLSNANSVKTDFFEAKSTAYAKASVLIDDL